MRIAQLANFIGPGSGGMKTAVAALGHGYVEAGAERLLVVPGPTDARFESDLGPVVQVRAPRVVGQYRLIVEPWRVIDVLEEFGPTTVELSDKTTLLPVTRWARRRGVGTVLLSHERLGDMFASYSKWDTSAKASIQLLNRVLVRAFDTIVVTSRYAQREFQHLADAVGCPMVRVPLGVDLETFQALPSVPDPDGVLKLTHIGRLSREKFPQLAIATAVELWRRGVPVRMDVYGEGTNSEEIKAAVDPAAPVHFHGFVEGREELNRRIADADIALSVSPQETFGLAVLESLASGTPVVTANRGGARELVDAHSGAWAAPEPGALADAVLELASRPRTATREAARQRAEQFPWERTVSRMLDVHAQIADLVPATA